MAKEVAQVRVKLDEKSERLLDEKLAEINRGIEALEKLREQVKALERRGNREQAFFAGRRSMAYELRESGGLASAKLGTEILFLLPDDFVQFYGSLFHRALVVGDRAASGTGKDGGVEKAKGNTGTVLGSDTRLQAQGTGKRYRNTGMTIGNEDILKLKGRLDGELVRLTREYAGYIGLQASGASEAGEEGGGNGKPRSPGVGSGKKCATETCRRFVKVEWKFCPGCGGQLEVHGRGTR